ncbi:MAG: phosphate signaling complex protein PhoU [Acidobacteria bacterium]|nr:phosphate signaling complex protein PhoU [Acidobacteriota bacterium]
MTRLEKHYAEHLETLSSKLMRMGGLVEQAVERALEALVNRDCELARAVIEADNDINRLELEIDQLGLELLARYQPAARDLRLIVAAMQINTDLERMGDLAVNMCKRVEELCQEPPLKPLIDLPAMGRRAQEMLRGALDAFVARDATAARAVIGKDDDLDHRMESGFRELVSYMIEDPRNITRAIRLAFIAKLLERIGDQATNICELVVFMAEGTVIKHAHLTGAPRKLPDTAGEPPSGPRTA